MTTHSASVPVRIARGTVKTLVAAIWVVSAAITCYIQMFTQYGQPERTTGIPEVDVAAQAITVGVPLALYLVAAIVQTRD